MATQRIGNRLVSSLQAAAKDHFTWDDEVRGFGVKVTPTGSKVYVFDYRMGGRSAKKQRVTIGKHGAHTPASAREEARRLTRLVGQGIDPRREQRERQYQAVTLNVEAYVERFIAEYISQRWKGGAELAIGLLRRHVVPCWRGRHLAEITRGDVAALMDRFGTAVAARRNCFAVVRKMFRFAVNSGHIDRSPVQDMEPPQAPPSRERVLSDDELKAVWGASDTLGYPFGPFFQLLILTGQRRQEVAALEWSELNRSTQMWTIPAARAKNGVVSDVPLSDAAIALLDRLARLASGLGVESAPINWPQKGYVFSTVGKRPISGYSKAKSRLDRALSDRQVSSDTGDDPAGPMPPWRVHDLRRTLATGMQKLGVRLEVTEALLNHISGSRSGIVGVYQRHEYGPEKRDAIRKWADHLQMLVSGKSDGAAKRSKAKRRKART